MEKLKIIIDKKEIETNKIRNWEISREQKTLKNLKKYLGEQVFHDMLKNGGFSQELSEQKERKEAIAYLKLEMGHEKILDMLSRDIKLSDMFMKFMIKLSGDKRKICSIEILCENDKTNVLSWYVNNKVINDEKKMISAISDHYLFRLLSPDEQEIIEVAGGSPVASRFIAKMNDTEKLVTKRDSSYEYELTATVYLADKTAVAGIRHQFRHEKEGFRILLQIEFPKMIPNYIIKKHQYHLAVEFSNWISMAIKDKKENIIS